MDRINFEVLEDGAVRFSTDKISKKNHANADEFMEMMKDFIGEVKEVKKVKHSHEHAHQHIHQH